MTETQESLVNIQTVEMTNLDVTQRPGYDPDNFEWKNALFSHPDGYPSKYGGYGNFGMEVDEQYIDKEMMHEDWPTLEQMQRVANNQTSLAVSSYGLTAYKAFQEEEGMTIVMLDERVFAPVNLQEVMQEAANIAMDEGSTEDAIPFLKGIIAAAFTGNFPVESILPFKDTFFRTGRHDMIRLYVENVCNTTVKGPEDSWKRLKDLGNTVKNLAISKNSYFVESKDETFSVLQRQILLEYIAHAWIRRSMPIQELDFLS